MAAEWYEKGLRNMVRDIRSTTFSGTAEEQEAQLLVVIDRKIGTLLAAGHVMRERLNNQGPGGMWDAAKKAFLEGCDEV